MRLMKGTLTTHAGASVTCCPLLRLMAPTAEQAQAQVQELVQVREQEQEQGEARVVARLLLAQLQEGDC